MFLPHLINVESWTCQLFLSKFFVLEWRGQNKHFTEGDGAVRLLTHFLTVRRPDRKKVLGRNTIDTKTKIAQIWEQIQAAGAKGRVVNSFVQRFFSVGLSPCQRHVLQISPFCCSDNALRSRKFLNLKGYNQGSFILLLKICLNAEESIFKVFFET